MTLGFAILGAGRIGQAHARAISATPGATFVALAEPFHQAADDMAARYGCDLRTIDEIASSDDVQAVAICTPTDTHADLIEKFARAGKAIFCEKPVDLSAERVKQALATVEETGAKLMVGFNRRFDPDFLSVKAAIDNGTIGVVEMVVITSRDPGPPPASYIKVSGGIFRDMTIHDFDMARWLLGEEPVTVMAQGSVLVDPEIGELGDYDSVNVILKTVSGKQCVITNSRRATYGYDQRIEVHGSDGMAAAANRHESTVEVAGAGGFGRPPLLNFFMDRYAAAYANEIAAFVAAVNEGTALPTTGEDGLKALQLADAALESAQSGKAVTLT
ncbi:inositol 2-dehydrogenase [Mameliella sp.]|uniref:inositol 2-dehydrogenase n=1 Tax=Mameliella sp. TaxID=1924940 RepID=UPI003B500515